MATLNHSSLHSLIFTASLLLGINCSTSKAVATVNSIEGSKLKAFGRSLSNGETLELIGSAAHLSVNFDGTSCIVYASIGSGGTRNYLQYELDGNYIGRLRIDGDQAIPIPIDMASTGRHQLTLYKATEAQTGPIYISKIDAKNIEVVEANSNPIIEFIGNSITCGASSDLSVASCTQGQYQDHHNAYYAFGPRAARALNANYFLSSVSGIGIYRTWNRNGPSMPQLYEKTDLQLQSTRQWDFSRYSPAIVTIELGTNDLSEGDGSPRAAFDSTVFIRDYIEFIKLVKSKYPTATIALLNSPIVSGDPRMMLEACLQSIKTSINKSFPNDKQLEVFSFAEITGNGCFNHPSVDQQGAMAAQVQPFLQRLLLER